MALPQARTRDPHEPRALLEIGNRRGAGIAHRRLHAADQLVDDIPGRPLERHLSFDPFGHQLELILDIALEIAVGRAAPHCADRPPAAVALIRTPLIEERLARCLFGAREPRADHARSEEHTSELQSLMRISYAVFCFKKKNTTAPH